VVAVEVVVRVSAEPEVDDSQAGAASATRASSPSSLAPGPGETLTAIFPLLAGRWMALLACMRRISLGNP
jgi:hypothetical protein